MSQDYFAELPPMLILRLSPLLSVPSLNALASACRRLHEILQPELESRFIRLAPKLGEALLHWVAAASKPHMVAKIIFPPLSIHASPSDQWDNPLYVAAKARNLAIAQLLLDAGADVGADAEEWEQDEYQGTTMSQDYFAEFPPEPKPHIVAKIISPPLSIHPPPSDSWGLGPLDVAAQAGNLAIVRLFLDADVDVGADAEEWEQDKYQALYLAAENKDLEMMKLLLDHGALVDARFGRNGCRETVLHYACSIAHLEMIQLLLDRGANLECRGHYGSALGFAVHRRNLDVIKLLLDKGADATVSVPLFILLDASLLYIAMGLRHPSSNRDRQRWLRQQRSPAKRWEGLPLSQEKKELMALTLPWTQF
ncbi:ankyrin repeat-containing domain protein [Mycena olivaceomarginata]|nr:ankyrin repeat-containing domain protein [Mycena olivaceomarginata]